MDGELDCRAMPPRRRQRRLAVKLLPRSLKLSPELRNSPWTHGKSPGRVERAFARRQALGDSAAERTQRGQPGGEVDPAGRNVSGPGLLVLDQDLLPFTSVGIELIEAINSKSLPLLRVARRHILDIEAAADMAPFPDLLHRVVGQRRWKCEVLSSTLNEPGVGGQCVDDRLIDHLLAEIWAKLPETEFGLAPNSGHQHQEAAMPDRDLIVWLTAIESRDRGTISLQRETALAGAVMFRATQPPREARLNTQKQKAGINRLLTKRWRLTPR